MSSYATPQDFRLYGLPPVAIPRSITDNDIQAELDSVAGEVDGMLTSRYTLPLQGPPFPKELVRHVCAMAAWNLLSTRGFGPEDGSDQTVRTRFEDSRRFFERISDGKERPPWPDSAAGEEGGPNVVQPAPGSQGGMVVVSTPKLRGY